MAYFKYQNVLTQQDGNEFDILHAPGGQTPHSGIYRCEVCGGSAVSTLGNPLPPQGHHPHTNNAPIRWRLIVKTHFR